jgi:hypothetical protein
VAGPPYDGVGGNTVLILTYVADYFNPNTTCPFNYTNEATILCTGQQIGPYLVLTSSNCLAGEALVGRPGCENSQLVDAYGESTMHHVCYQQRCGQTTEAAAVQGLVPILFSGAGPAQKSI